MSRSYWIVGPGRMGLSLGSILSATPGSAEILLVGRREGVPGHHPRDRLERPAVRYASCLPGPPPARTVVVVAVPDGAIEDVAGEIAGLGAPGAGCVALHLSGARPAGILGELAGRGYAVGSLHPLQTVPDAERGPERLRGAFFTFEGDPGARGPAAEIVKAAGGRMLEVHAADKARYHAACVFASNYVVACAAVATRLLADSVEISREEAARALQPLWSGAVANLKEPGLPGALTGPVARGDIETVRANLAALDGAPRELYARLGLEALAVGREMGLDPGLADAIEAELRGSAER